MLFDHYYNFPCDNLKSTASTVRSHSCTNSVSSESTSFVVDSPGKKRVIDAASMPVFTHMGSRWNGKTSHWTLWTLRDPLLMESCYSGSTSITQPQKNQVQKTKFEFLEMLTKSVYKLCSEFGQIPMSAIVVKSVRHPIYNSNKMFFYGETFFYSYNSDTLAIDVMEMSFLSNGRKKEAKTTPSTIQVLACSGLAQILAACLKSEDIFVIIGKDIQFAKNDGSPQILLNLITDEKETMEDLIVIRLCFDIRDTNVRMIEKITPFSEQEWFSFKYVSRDLSTQFSREIVRHRRFSLKYGLDPADKDFKMPVIRDADVRDAYGKLLSAQYSWERKSRISLSSSSSGYASSRSSLSDYQLSPFEPTAPSCQIRRESKFKTSEMFHRYSAEFDGDIASFDTTDPPCSSGSDSFFIKFLKIFACIICPLIVLGVFAILFQPATPNCPCEPDYISSPIEEEFNSHRCNYDNVHAIPLDF